MWLDALVTNPDRTARNVNLLWWHGRLHPIDHGAALFFHHAPAPVPGHARRPFEQIADHVLLPYAAPIAEADARLAPQVTRGLLDDVVARVPDVWLDGDDPGVYVEYLAERLEEPRAWVDAAEAARGR